jgi:fructokinase
MKQYHVYAIGNALVDMEYLVDDPFLSQHRIDKGVMTLVDQTAQQTLRQALSGHTGKRASGGSAANTIIAVNHLGGRAYYACKVANDEIGDFYVHDLSQAGVHTNLHKEREAGVTGQCVVMITPDAERTMHTFLGISEQVSEQDVDAQAIAQSEFVYLEGYLVTSASARPAAMAARRIAEQAGVKTALTFSDPNMVRFFRDGLQAMLGEGVDLLFCNRQEALLWAETEDLETAAARLLTVARSFAITLGADGALVHDGRQAYHIPGKPVKAIDTNGAGDLFAGAFLYAITHGMDYCQAGAFACEAAALLVTKMGPRLQPEEYRLLSAARGFEQFA